MATETPPMSGSEVPPERLLSEDDFRGVVRLLAEIAAMPGHAAPAEGTAPRSAAGVDTLVQAKKKRLLGGLGEMIGADMALWVVSRDIGPDGMPMCLSLVHTGATDERLALIMRATQDPVDGPPEDPHMLADLARYTHFTRCRRDWVDDRAWYGARHFEKHRRPIGVDDFIFSVSRIGPDTLSGVGFHRAVGRPHFSDRDRRLVHLVISEIGPLHRAGVPAEGGRGVPELSPRLRTVLGLLLQGQDRATIAGGLGLSEHTVNDYIKAIYKHFRVRHRGQLLAKFMAGEGPVEAL